MFDFIGSYKIDKRLILLIINITASSEREKESSNAFGSGAQVYNIHT